MSTARFIVVFLALLALSLYLLRAGVHQTRRGDEARGASNRVPGAPDAGRATQSCAGVSRLPAQAPRGDSMSTQKINLRADGELRTIENHVGDIFVINADKMPVAIIPKDVENKEAFARKIVAADALLKACDDFVSGTLHAHWIGHPDAIENAQRAIALAEGGEDDA